MVSTVPSEGLNQNQTAATGFTWWTPGPLLLGRSQPDTTASTSLAVSLQLCFWVLIQLLHDLHLNYSVLGPLSPVGLWFWIWAILVSLLLKTHDVGIISSGISLQLNEYWSDCKLETWARNTLWNRMTYMYTMSWYSKYWKTCLLPQL